MTCLPFLKWLPPVGEATNALGAIKSSKCFMFNIDATKH